MKSSAINFFFEEVDAVLSKSRTKRHWLHQVIDSEGFTLGNLSYIFCSDKYLHRINLERLAHDDLTDIITFDQSDDDDTVEGDIFISIDRVRDNAAKLDQTYDRELSRVMVHGILHLMGFTDKTPEGKAEMREKEDTCLSLYPF